MLRFNGFNAEHASVYSPSDSVIPYPLWLNSSAPHFSPPSFPKNLNLNIDSSRQCSNQMKQHGWQLNHQDSSSTQSTGQSCQDAACVRGGNVHVQFLPIQSGSDDMDATEETDVEVKSFFSLGTPVTSHPAPKDNFSEKNAGISYTYMDPCFGGFKASYGPHGIIHPQMVRNAPPGRVPLPIQLTDDEPIYVNAKQYHGILRRRKQRAKLEALNKLAKIRKPYLHESRHRHAMRRIRGSGGRFLNTKHLKQQQEQLEWKHQQSKSYISTNDGKASSALSLLIGGEGRLWGSNLQLMNGNSVASGDSSSSGVTSMANPSETLELPDHIRFAEFLGSTPTGASMLYNRFQSQMPVIR